MTTHSRTLQKVLTAATTAIALTISLLGGVQAASASNVEVRFGGDLFKDLSPTQWGLTAVRAREAWSTTKGAGVTVAVIDTGVDGTHPDLLGRVVDGYSTVTKLNLVGSENNDGNAHGTHVATIIAGDDDNDGVVGVAPEATIMVVQALGEGGSGNDRTVADAIDFAVANGAKVINLSLGGEVNPFQNGGLISCAAVGRAYDADVVVVVAAGNAGGYGNPLNQPASCRGSLSVAAIDEAMARTSFSSYDASVRISAPGRRVVAGVPNTGGFPYDQWNGTSMAAPFVAGVAALVRAANPGLTASEVIDRILSGATDIATPGVDSETGAGLVDAVAALGGTRRSVTEARASVTAVNTPRVLRAVTDGKTTTLSWEAPIGVKVTGYKVAYHGPDGQELIESVPDGKLTATINAASFPYGWVSVVAETPNGQRRSFPFTNATYNPVYEGNTAKVIVNKLSARWVKEGIEVTFKTNGAAGTVDVFVTGIDDRLLANVTVPSTATRHVVKLAANDPARSAYASVLVYADSGGSKRLDLEPQNLISASALTGGANHRAVSGVTTHACFTKRVACQGSVIEIRDLTTNKLLGSTRVLENLRYSVTFKWNGTTPTKVRAVVGNLRSPVVTLSPIAAATKQARVATTPTTAKGVRS
jgi:hypothetical protein